MPLRRDKFLANAILLLEKERQIPDQTHDKESTLTLIITSCVYPYTVMITKNSTLNSNKYRAPIVNTSKNS